MGRCHNNLINSKSKINIIKELRKEKRNAYKLSKDLGNAYSTIYEHLQWLKENQLIRLVNGKYENIEENIKNYVLYSTEYQNILKEYKNKIDDMKNIYIR